MQIKTTKKDVLWNYVGTAFSMIGNFLLLPFLVFLLSDEMLGLWYVYVAVGNLVMLFEFGFNPTFARNFAFCWSGADRLTKEGCVRSGADKDIDSSLLAHLLGACRRVYKRITLIALFVLLVPGTLYIASVAGSLDVLEVYLSWAVFACAVLFNLYYLYYAAMLRGIGSIAIESKVKVIARLSQLALTIVLLFLGFGIIGAAIGFFTNALLYRLLSYRAFWGDGRVRSLGLRSIRLDKARVKEVYKTVSYNAYKDGGIQISNYVSTQASSLICSSCLGLAQAGTFSIALQFATAIGNMALALMNSYRPMLQSAFQRGDGGLVNKTFSKCVLAYCVLFVAMFLVVLAIAYPLLTIFKPGASFDPLVFCGVSLYMFLFDWCALFAAMLCNMNEIPYLKAYVITSIIGLLSSVLMVVYTPLGIWGLILGLALPQCAYNVWKWPHEASIRLRTTVIELLSMGVKDALRR